MGYLFPFDRSIRLGQPFGSRPNMPPNPAGGHNGDDWLTVIGIPVRAAGDGVVVFAGQFDSTYEDNFGWNLHYGGDMVVLKMDGKYEPYFEYGHLSRYVVKTGDRVQRGQIIAYTGNSDGNTGVSTGPHCHVGCLPWNFNLNTNTYGRVNPRQYLTDYWDPSQITPLGSTVTPIQEDELALTDETKEEFRKLFVEGMDRYSMDVRRFDGNRNMLDAFKQLQAENAALSAAIKGVPESVLFGNRVDGRNLIDWQKQIRADIVNVKPGTTVDIPELAKALSEQLEAKDITALAAQLQITVKDAQ